MRRVLLLMTVLTLMSGSVFASAEGRAPSRPSTVDLSEFDHLDPRGIVPERPLRQALTYFKQNRSAFPNQKYMVIVDFTKHSREKRMFVINLRSGSVNAYATSHGRGSDPGHTGRATRFSNSNRSHMSSLGFYRTAEPYVGKHGPSLRMDGLSPTNSQARRRAIVVHGARYVSNTRGAWGRSHGCPAVAPETITHLRERIRHGALFYIWAGQ